MVFIGAFAVILCAYLTWREYSAFLEKQLSSCRAFLRALSDYREKMKCYLLTPRDWASDYNDGFLSACGFTESLASGVGILEAYKKHCADINMTQATDEIMTACFDRMGDGYLDTELQAIEIAIDKLATEEKNVAEQLLKKRKAAGAVLGACASGIIILVI